MMMDKKTIQEMAFWVRVHIPDAEAETMAKEFPRPSIGWGSALKIRNFKR